MWIKLENECKKVKAAAPNFLFVGHIEGTKAALITYIFR